MVRPSDSGAWLQNRSVLVFDGTGDVFDYAVKKWQEISGTAIRDKGRFTVALSGGATPVNLYRQLAGCSSYPWDKTHIFLVDERFVPFDHPESNYRMLRNTLLSNVGIAEGNVHPIPADAENSEAAAREYERDLKRLFSLTAGQFPGFDLILLGIGEDGHTASLFPGTSSLAENKRLAVAVRSEAVAYERISITFPVINSGENVVFLATGRNKATVVKKILAEKNSSLPAGRVQPASGALLFLLDKDSGAHLAGSELRSRIA